MIKKVLFYLTLMALAVMLTGLAFQLPTRIEEVPPRPPTATPFTGTRLILSLESGSSYSSGWWTVVQWRDQSGKWHDVEGWEGTFDQNRQVIWWVGSDHFGSGPFRWVVYESAEREHELVMSEKFDLPSSRYTLLELKINVSSVP